MSEVTIKSSLSGKKLDKAEDVADLVEQIQKNEDTLETLQLDGNSYGVEPLKEIGGALQNCNNLKHLLLNDMFISRLKNEIPEALRNLLNGVQISQAQIITLNLNDNAIGPVTMPDLLPFLNSDQCNSLQKLYLNNCGLGIKGGTMLSTALCGLDNLTELVIGRNRLEIDGILEISLAISKLNKLERLELPQNGTKEQAISQLCLAIKQNKNLKILNLNDNVLTTTAQDLADALKVLENLEILNLGDCLLKTKGAQIILLALQTISKEKFCSKIKEINLSGNEIGKDAKDVICQTLDSILETRQDAKQRLKIDLSGNNFGEEVTEELKQHFDSVIDLIIEDDQGSEDENDDDGENQEEDNEDVSFIKESNQSIISNNGDSQPIQDDLFDNPEQLQNYLESKYKDLDSLCRRFYQLSSDGFDFKQNKIDDRSMKEIEALIKIGKKNFRKNDQDFTLLNQLAAACGLLKSEDKSLTPKKDKDLSGPIIALAKVAKELSSDYNQKRCIKDLVMNKVKEDRYKHLEHTINSLIYSF